MKKVLLGAALALAATSSMATTCTDLPKYEELKTVLQQVTSGGAAANGGIGMPVWLSLVDTSGTVCAIVHPLDSSVKEFDVTSEMAMAHRVISIHKANTANAFSTNMIGVASGNLFSASAPGGAAYGYNLDSQIDPFLGKPIFFGTTKDPVIGKRLGGYDTTAGGLALFDNNKKKIGAIGVSGDTHCSNHVIAWKIREQLASGAYKSTNVPFGLSAKYNDMLIQDIIPDTKTGGAGFSESSYGHPQCRNNPTVEQAAGSIEFHSDITGEAKH